MAVSSSQLSLMKSLRGYARQGEPWVWATAGAIAVVMFMLVGMLLVVLANGAGYFWPHAVQDILLQDGTHKLAIVVDQNDNTAGDSQYFVRVGNRDLYGADFEWIEATAIQSMAAPQDVVVLERVEHGPFYGYVQGLLEGETRAELSWTELQARRAQITTLQHAVEDKLAAISVLNEDVYQIEAAHKKATYYGETVDGDSGIARRAAELHSQIESLQAAYEKDIQAMRSQSIIMHDAQGTEKVIALADVLNVYRPNQMSLWQRIRHYMTEFYKLLTENPRESNTEGGIFPALFGTAVMVLLMSLFSMPLGVITAIYLREYVRDGRTLRLIRIAVNNLAGVPSIVYGVFGLGFLIYTVGSAIDAAFYPYMAPTPVFGTGGILWASITLSLLTVPVVVVATEEALAAIPKDIREASLALGATRFQTLWRVLLPMATPGILTGFILSMARAAGEVAPLMLTGAVKLAPTLPLDGSFPYAHLDRKFMHLGFHIYDLAFQSPNVEAVKPMVYVTTMLLLVLVFLLSIVAMVLRNRMRRKYSTGAF